MITIRPSTSVSQIATWPADSADLIDIRLSRHSGFKPGAEAVAVAKIADALDRGARFATVIEQATLEIADYRKLFLSAPPLLFGLFGLQLLYGSEKLCDSRGFDLKDQLLDLLWPEIKRSSELTKLQPKLPGTLPGPRGRLTIICRDPDYPVPECLREGPTTVCPREKTFRQVYTSLAATIAPQQGHRLAGSNAALVSFLYEAFANAHEHGRSRHQQSSACLVRGIIFERINFHSTEDAERRGDLDGPLGDYVKQMRAAADPAAGFLLITVADLGLGIQNTLPPLNEHETPRQRLLRSFDDGVTSKPKGTDVQLGRGLGHILEACRTLKALLLVHSASDFLYFNGAAPGERAEFQEHREWANAKRCGTAMTIAMASYQYAQAPGETVPAEQQLFGI